VVRITPVEHGAALAILCGILCVAFGLYIATPFYAATVPEYLFKFLPALSDAPVRAAFDFVGLGDGRPRLVSNLLTTLNVQLRAAAIDAGFFHLGLSLTWLIYPTTLALLYAGLRRWSGDSRMAWIGTLLYAASPAALDPLVAYYVPAKPVAHLLTVSAFLGTALVLPASASVRARPMLGGCIVGTSVLFGLLCDETMLLAYIVLAAAFVPRFLRAQSRPKVFLCVSGLVFPLAIYGVLVAWVLPEINSALGQVPLNFFSVAFQGVYAAVFGVSGVSASPAGFQIATFNLAETVLSAHLVPFRHVPGSWTYHAGFHFFQWAPNDQLAFGAAMMILAALWFQASSGHRRTIWFLIVGFAAFAFAQAILLRPLASVLLEVSYYASLSSLWFALIVGTLLASGPVDSQWKAIRWLLVSYFVFVEFANHEETARRHPYWSEPAPDWHAMRNAKESIDRGEFQDLARRSPFPDRIYFAAYEMEIARRAKQGYLADIKPRYPVQDLPIATAPASAYRDNVVFAASQVPALDERKLMGSGTATKVSASDLLTTIRGTNLRGSSGPWRFIRSIGSDGTVVERVWFDGLMRQWELKGRVAVQGRQLCTSYDNAPAECISRAYAEEGVIYGFSSSGVLITGFRVVR
jgi:hypothetical protein